jgi:hypothetical protein
MSTVTELFKKTTDGKGPDQTIGADAHQFFYFPTMQMFTRKGEAYFRAEEPKTGLKGNFIGLPRDNEGLTIWLTEPALKVSFKYWIRGGGAEGVKAIEATFYDESSQLCETVVLKTKAEDYVGTLESTSGKKIKSVNLASPSYNNAVNHFELTR